MSRHTLFISDLHLQAERPEITAIFRRFLENQALEAEALYILGDFFEMWIGDDEDTAFNRSIKTLLKAFTGRGIPVYFMPGNHDFLVGRVFAEETGCQLLADPSVIQLYGRLVLLKHGDDLCTGDTHHLRFRRITQHPYVQRLFLSLPLRARSWLGNKIRDMSMHHTRNKPMTSMDVSAEAVAQLMQATQIRRLIHGHTHRPAIHHLQVDGQAAERIVLAAWHRQGGALVYHQSGKYEIACFS